MTVNYYIKGFAGLICVCLIALSSCDEELPALGFSENRLVDTVYVTPTGEAAQAKVVVMEEFSGVR